MVRKVRLAGFGLGIAAFGLFAACSGGDGQAPTPSPLASATPAPSASPTPPPSATAPAGSGLFAYLVGGPGDDPGGPVTIAVFDMAAGKERAAETFATERPNHAAVWRDGLVLAFNRRIELADFDIANRRIVFEPPPTSEAAIADIAVSPDGNYLALTIEPAACGGAGCTFYGSQLYVIELPQGREVLKLDWPDPSQHGFDGALWQLHWRDDGKGVWVGGATHSERPGTKATVMLDGSVRIEPLDGFVSIAPGGRIAAHGPGSLGCMFIAGHSLSIIDLDSGSRLFSVEDADMAFTPWEWSPAGDEFVFAARPYPPATAPGECDWVNAEPEWRVARLDGSPPRVITRQELLALRSTWYEGRFVAAGCASPDNPLLGRYGDAAPQCDPSLPAGAIRVNGVDVGRTGRLGIIGFAE